MTLSGGQIAVWTVCLGADRGADCLSPEERGRADAAIDPVQRLRRARSRSVLRRILSVHTGVAPLDLVLAVDPGGKPRLAHGPHFNLSHTGDTMMVAVCAAGPVGIDVERLGRLDSDWAPVTQRTFSARERAALADMPEAQRPGAALRGWVRKEAYAKARGAGFAYGFPAFTVSLEPDHCGSSLIEDALDPGAADAWRLHGLEAPEGHIASLASAAACGTAFHLAFADLDP